MAHYYPLEEKHYKKYVVTYHSSEWSAWWRNDESGIQQLSFEGKMFRHQNLRAVRIRLTSLETLMFSKRKGDILWQVTNHYWRCVGRSLVMCICCHIVLYSLNTFSSLLREGNFREYWRFIEHFAAWEWQKIVASDSSSESQLASTMNHTVNSII